MSTETNKLMTWEEFQQHWNLSQITGSHPAQDTTATKNEYDKIVNTPPEQLHEIQGMKLTTNELPEQSEIQVGGSHYKKCAIQPWDFVIANDLDYFQGSIIKYVTRWKDKGWIQDLHKAKHFLDKYIETMEEKHKHLTDRPE